MLRGMNEEDVLAHRAAYVAGCFHIFVTQTQLMKQKHSELSARYLQFQLEINVHIYDFVIVRKKFISLLYTLSMETSSTFLTVL